MDKKVKSVFNEARMEGYAQGMELGQNVQFFKRNYCLDRYLDIFDRAALAGELARLHCLFEMVAQEGLNIQKKENVSDPAKISYQKSYKTRLHVLEQTMIVVDNMLEAMRSEEYVISFPSLKKIIDRKETNLN